MKPIFLSLVYLFSLCLLDQEKLVFKSCAGQPETQADSQQAANKRLSALLPELWWQEGLAFGDSIALLLHFNYDNLLQYSNFEALRVDSQIPHPKAALVKGEAVRMSFTLPINTLLK